jgi:hypothetical protein
MSDTRGADLGTAPPKHEGAAAESPEQTAESVDDQPIKIEVDDEERPAFLVPIVFVLTGPCEYLLGHGPVLGVLWTTVIACVGVAALAAATGGWILGVGPARPLARVLAAVGGLVLLYLEPGAIVAGLVALATAVGVTLFSRRRAT